MYVDTKSVLKPEDIIYKTSLVTKYILYIELVHLTSEEELLG